MSPLAIDWVPWVGAACALFVVGIALAVLVVRRGHDDALDPEVEARLLLGEDPDEIDRDLAQRAGAMAPVTDHPLLDESTD
jgi:hypothetical protein